MPAALPFPGVQIQEIPAGVRPIVGVSTSVTAFLGRAPRGPVNVATRCFSFDDFARKFGGLWAESPMTYAVYHYFLNGGTEAVIVRLAPGAAAATLNLPTTGGSPANLVLAAASAGEWGRNVRVSVTDPAAGTISTAEQDLVFTLTVREVDPLAPNDRTRDRTTETFVNVSVDANSPRALDRARLHLVPLSPHLSLPFT